MVGFGFASRLPPTESLSIGSAGCTGADGAKTCRGGIVKTLVDGYQRVDSNDYLNAISIRKKLLNPDAAVFQHTHGRQTQY